MMSDDRSSWVARGGEGEEYQSGYGRSPWGYPDDDEDRYESGSSSGVETSMEPPIRVRDEDLHSTRDQKHGTDFRFEMTSKASPYSSKPHQKPLDNLSSSAMTSFMTSSILNALLLSLLVGVMQRILVGP